MEGNEPTKLSKETDINAESKTSTHSEIPKDTELEAQVCTQRTSRAKTNNE